MTVTRPALRYHGGKWRLAPWIISRFPAHRCYVEPFGGAASVLLRKPRSYSEVYNDMDGEIVNLFKVLRDPSSARELLRILRLTPYARAEFETSYLVADDPIERARRTAFRSMAGYSSIAATGKWRTGFRCRQFESRTSAANDWRTYPDALEAIVERLRGVVIEQDTAIEVLNRYDRRDTLFYLDPPYPVDTRYVRWAGEAYRYEMTDDEHRELARAVKSLTGMFVISGYACPLYDEELYPGWIRIQTEAHADGAKDRIEVLWISPNVRTGSAQGNLF